MPQGTNGQLLEESSHPTAFTKRQEVALDLPMPPRKGREQLEGMVATPKIEKEDRQKPLPMSFGQQQMWLLQQTLSDPATYNEPVACRIKGPVNTSRIADALHHIMRRHEVLRTALIEEKEILVQQVLDPGTVKLPWKEMDLTSLPPDRRAATLEESLRAWTREPFDLARAPLWRVVWVKLGNEEHVLAVTFHRAIIDEWSLRLFFEEFEKIYVFGEEAGEHLPELTVQYADFSLWQRRLLAGPFLETQRHYWREQLRSLPPPLELPADKLRPRQSSGRGATHQFKLDDPTVAGLRALARGQQTGLLTVVLAAFQAWIYRYTGETDIIVGTPIANRARPEVQNLLGYFLNTLPIRTRLDGNSPFQTLLQQVRETVAGAFNNAGLPFEQMPGLAARELPSERHPIYQVMFGLFEEEFPALNLGQATGEFLSINTTTSKFDLTVKVHCRKEFWECEMEYATDLFSSAQVRRMGSHLAELLRSVAENPEKPIDHSGLLPAVERRQILVEWNQTQKTYPREKCLHQLFEEQVEQTPDAVAVVNGNFSLSYRELNQRADQLARQLQVQGVRPHDLVAACLHRSPEAIISLLGILKTGGAYVPLDPALPEERLSFLVGDAGVSVVIVKSAPDWRLPAATRMVFVDAERPLSQHGGRTEPSQFVGADSLAYVMYTSGSTGTPKGVCVPHRAIARLVLNTNYLQLGPADVVAQVSNLAFDAATFEIWGALLNGARLEIISKETLLAPERLAALLRARQINTLFLTTALFNMLGRISPGIFQTLKQVLFGGEAADPYPVQSVLQNGAPQRLVHVYGPTETTTFATWQLVETLPPGAVTVPIGRPIANTTAYILDSQQNPVPIGLPGEIYIGGDGLARGYLHETRLTAQRFIAHPFSELPGERLYRTGDLARWRPDGSIEFLGRLDSQVKIRGFRVELGEIEISLRLQPEIREAVVILREDSTGEKKLTGYLVAKSAEKPDAEILRARLAERLPEYMVPSSLVWLDHLPLTANGKVDRKALPAHEIVERTVKSTAPPINLLEWEFVRIWQRIFQRDDIGRHDNFFALGGHSLLATRLASETDKLLGSKLPIAAVFQSPTIELLAQRFLEENWAPPWSSLVPLQPNGTKPPLFFVHGVGGDVFGFVELAGLLGPDQPSYGIQAVGLDGKAKRHVSVEEMAAYYVKEMVSFQPEGPFSLAGYSLGGIIAYEIAQQLHRLGRKVSLLALLDCGPVGSTPWLYYGLAMATYIPGRVWHHLRRWFQMPRRDKVEYIQGRLGALANLAMDNLPKPRLVTAPPPMDGRPPQLPIDIDYYHAIALPYHLGPYPGCIDLFVSDEGISGWRWYWRHLGYGRVSFHRIPGRHLEILSPENLPVLANSLRGVLQRAPLEK